MNFRTQTILLLGKLYPSSFRVPVAVGPAYTEWLGDFNQAWKRAVRVVKPVTANSEASNEFRVLCQLEIELGLGTVFAELVSKVKWYLDPFYAGYAVPPRLEEIGSTTLKAYIEVFHDFDVSDPVACAIVVEFEMDLGDKFGESVEAYCESEDQD